MAECITEGCSNQALFSTICAFCALGKYPSAAEKARYRPPVVQPFVTWMGTIHDQFDDQQEKKALTIAGSPSSGDGSLTTVNGMRVHHHTVPRVNFSIWYIRNVSGVQITVYGLGRHIGTTNKKYDVIWYDGSSITVNL
jgi:hypothetical protein